MDGQYHTQSVCPLGWVWLGLAESGWFICGAGYLLGLVWGEEKLFWPWY